MIKDITIFQTTLTCTSVKLIIFVSQIGFNRIVFKTKKYWYIDNLDSVCFVKYDISAFVQGREGTRIVNKHLCKV